MNKDIYYIEPEDDITDIINHLKGSKQKVVALVPPKKLSVLRSAINLKLIAKTAKNLDKAVVIITLDPVLMKLSAASGLPFSKNLQSRPVLPSEYKDSAVIHKTVAASQAISEMSEDSSDVQEESIQATESASNNKKENISKDSAAKENFKKPANSGKTNNIRQTPSDAEAATMHLDANEVEEESDGEEKAVKKIPNFDKLRKWLVLGVAGLIVCIVGGVWAFVFAPAA